MLVLRDLVKVYPGPVSALQGIDLEVGEGLFGLLGPNGAGKSTLMKIVAGLLEPTSGEVRLDGVEVTREPRLVWDKLGYLPQDFGFYPSLTGRAMLTHMLRLKGVRAEGMGRRKLVDRLLEHVHLEDAARRKVREYSGGMRQRLGIAQALAGDPRLLVVDEPTAGLDPEERLRFYRLLAELARDRIVLLSTHIVEDVAVLCPEFAIIRQGRLVARTTPEAAKAALEGRVLQGDVSEERARELAETHTVLQAMFFQGGTRVRLLVDGDAPPEGFEPARATLEDAYLATMHAEARELPVGAAAGDPA